MLMMYKSKTPKHKYRFIKPSLKARLENCTKAMAKVNSDHLAESTSVASHSVSHMGVALASGLVFTLTPTVNPTHTHPGTW